MIDENRVREIVREEIERSVLKMIVDSLKEQQKAYDERLSRLSSIVENLVNISRENTRAIEELRKRTEENTKAIEELRKITEENTRAIEELRRRTEENTKAIEELRKTTEELKKRTEENTKAIAELRATVESLVKVVNKLVISVNGLNKRVGGLENMFGLVMEDIVRRDLVPWFKAQGVEIVEVKPRTVIINNKPYEFDIYVEHGNKVYLGEVKVTLRERDVTRFLEKLAVVRKYVSAELVPIIIYRNKIGKAVDIAKVSGIRVLKYLKGGAFMER